MSIIVYTCAVGVVLVIINLFTLSHSRCSTIVHYPSKGITSGVEIEDRVEIACRCDDDQLLLTTAWYFNGSRITNILLRNSNPYVTSLKNFGYLTLVVPNFLPGDAGNYICASGSDDKVIELNISQQCE